MSAVHSAIWLAIQGAFAIIRVLVWIFDHKFDDITISLKKPHQHIDYTQVCLAIEYFTLLGVYDTWVGHRAALEFPFWVNEGLEAVSVTWQSAFSIKPEDAFKTAREIRQGTVRQEVLVKLRSAKDFWDIPPLLFMIMADAEFRTSINRNVLQTRCQYSCRIVKDPDNKIHFLPYIPFYATASTYEMYDATFPPDAGIYWNGQWQAFRLRLFGIGRNCCLIGFDQKDDASFEKQHVLIDGLKPFSEAVPDWLTENWSRYFPKYNEPPPTMTLFSMMRKAGKGNKQPVLFGSAAARVYSEMWDKLNTSLDM